MDESVADWPLRPSRINKVARASHCRKHISSICCSCSSKAPSCCAHQANTQMYSSGVTLSVPLLHHHTSCSQAVSCHHSYTSGRRGQLHLPVRQRCNSSTNNFPLKCLPWRVFFNASILFLILLETVLIFFLDYHWAPITQWICESCLSLYSREAPGLTEDEVSKPGSSLCVCWFTDNNRCLLVCLIMFCTAGLNFLSYQTTCASLSLVSSHILYFIISQSLQ